MQSVEFLSIIIYICLLMLEYTLMWRMKLDNRLSKHCHVRMSRKRVFAQRDKLLPNKYSTNMLIYKPFFSI
jgi:hypothetical protein